MKSPVSALLALWLASGVNAEQATVAVATNFAWPMGELEALFEADGIHELTVVHGSTGQLFAQIVNGAPYDLFLAADGQRPHQLAERGLGGNPFTYALGRLALWTRHEEFSGNLTIDTLANASFRRLAMANPRLAPYGVAARETLETMGLWESMQPRIVLGENVGQTFAMVETRNAELGLIALSAALAYPSAGAYVPVPAQYHGQIRQDAILLARDRDNPAARAFVAFLQAPESRRIIAAAGYELP